MAYVPASSFPPHFHRDDGTLAVGCVLESWEAQTTTPLALYLDAGGSEAGTSFVLNDRGEIEVSGNSIIPWLDSEEHYKFTLTDPDSGQVWSVDDVFDVTRQRATTSQYGITRLYDDIDSQSDELAATANAVYLVAQLAQQAIAIASAGIPVGSMIPWPVATVPDNTWRECNGDELSTTDYAELFAVIGYAYGGSGGTFKLPDWRGKFLRGWDHSAGRDPDAATRTNRGDGTTGDNVGTNQADAIQGHAHGPHADGPQGFTLHNTSGGSLSGILDAGNDFPMVVRTTTGGPESLADYGTVRVAKETRGVNMSAVMMMKVRSVPA